MLIQQSFPVGAQKYTCGKPRQWQLYIHDVEKDRNVMKLTALLAYRTCIFVLWLNFADNNNLDRIICDISLGMYNMVPTTLQNSFSLTFQDKTNRFLWLIPSREIPMSVFNHLQLHRNKFESGGTNNLRTAVCIQHFQTFLHLC